MARRKIPWGDVKREYVQGVERDGKRVYPSQYDLAERYGVSQSSIWRKAKAENWAVEREIFAVRVQSECSQKTIDSLSDEGSQFDLSAFRAANAGVKRVEEAMTKTALMSPDDMTKLASAPKTFHQVGRLALGESTDNAEVNVVGARERLIALVDRAAGRQAAASSEQAQ